MNGTFTLQCKVCGCKVQIKASARKMPKPIFCFNCGQELPEQAHTALRDAIVAIHNLPAETEEQTGWISPDTGFLISLDVDSAQPKPEE